MKIRDRAIDVRGYAMQAYKEPEFAEQLSLLSLSLSVKNTNSQSLQSHSSTQLRFRYNPQHSEIPKTEEPQEPKEKKMPSGDLENRGSMKNRGPPQNPNGYYSTYYVESSETYWTSWLVPMIVVANIAVFVVVMYINNCPSNSTTTEEYGQCVAKFLGRFSFEPTKENPLLGPSSSTLLKLGALEWDKVVHQHQGWRLLTCMWLHAGVIHLLANMLSLVFIGIRLEQQFGFIRVGIIYFLSGFGGSILSSLFIQTSHNISVGASGALFGLLGAMLSELLTNWTIYSNKAAALLTLVVVIVINLALGILPHVDNFAHIGGFLTGFFLGFVLLARPQFGWVERQHLPSGAHGKSKYKVYQYVLWVVSVVLLIVGFTVGLVMLFNGENGNKYCSWCHYLSCVPTSKWKCGE
ncbi:Peptidase S54, rhomboid domain [Dillenia turbinata]|uniref:RHOMBOID-like protein n=1 Tax=Dillenia turbinata TaxID=194707 RepID=A0AAN8VWB6_9MAGN